MRELFRNWRVLLLIVFLLGSLGVLLFAGIQFGLDFKGGTFFQVQLDESASHDKMADTIVPIISQRVDAFGLKDTKVSALGADLVAVEIAETDPKQIERLETLLKTQGKFEATLDGTALIQGSDIVQIFKDPARGYGVHNTVDSAGKPTFGWQLPFILNQKAAEKFSRGVFHRCTATSFDPVKGSAYDCDSTFFFIDRPQGALFVLPGPVYTEDTQALLKGNQFRNIPQNTSIDLLVRNADVNLVLLDENLAFTAEQLATLKGFSGPKKAIVHSSVPQKARDDLASMGFKVLEANQQDKTVPWIWQAVGARQVISITAGIANLEPYVENEKDAKIFSELLITGGAQTADEAKSELKNLEVLLVTGSLPIGIKSISKESVSPLLGKEFLGNTFMIGIIALILVALVIFLRYRHLNIALPIVLTGISEIIIILGVAAVMRISLDLASVTGILAAIGTGVDHQIIIMDELLKGSGKQEEEAGSGTSYGSRINRAFFIIMAAAAAAMATMLPLFFGVGAGKLKGFAIMTILGVIIGVGITRPAFSVFAQYLLKHEKKQGN